MRVSLVIQWLRFCVFNAGGLGSIPGGKIRSNMPRGESKSSQTWSRKPSVTTVLVFYSVQSLNHVWLFVTLWIAAHQASLSIINSRSYLKLTSIKLVMSSNHLNLCCPLLLLLSIFPSIGVFSMSQLFTSGGQNFGASASASVLPMNIQDWFPLQLPGLISLQSKGLSRIFSSTTVQKHQFFSTQLSLWSNSHIHTWLLEKP